MNNDAKFFFCLSGFFGFIIFFIFGIIITNDPFVASVQSSFGCLFFAVCGRILLSFILNGIIVESISRNKKIETGNVSKQNDNDSSKLAEAMNESSTNSKHMVQAQV